MMRKMGVLGYFDAKMDVFYMKNGHFWHFVSTDCRFTHFFKPDFGIFDVKIQLSGEKSHKKSHFYL
jgi:hypothetical protein